MLQSPVLEGLNPAQRRAVTTVEGPLLVIAGAGSGKTRVITRRIAHLVEKGVDPRTILAVTFTNKAAREMRERVARLVGVEGATVSTFHSFGARFLRGEAHRIGRPESFSLYDRGDSEAAIKICLDELSLDRNAHAPRAVLEAISGWKGRMMGPEDADEEAISRWEEDVARVFRLYEEKLAAAGALDFDDLLHVSVRLLEREPEVLAELNRRFRYVLVDEYQDVNLAQYRLTRLLGDAHRNLCVTGDPDQCIYSWRGADIRYILGFSEDFPDAEVVLLEQNYRSVNTILKAASHLIRYNTRHGDKELWSERPEGQPIVVRRVADEQDEARCVVERIRTLAAQGVRRRDMAVFYRLNSLSLTVERALMSAGIPYQVVAGLEFFKRREVKDALSWLRWIANPDDPVALRRIVNTPPRGIGDKTVAILENAAGERGISLGRLVLETRGFRSILPTRAAKAVDAFAALARGLREDREGPVAKLLRRVLSESRLSEHLLEKADGLDPLGNLEQLVAFARESDAHPESRGLAGFLEDVALFTDVDGLQVDEDKVVLMTVHAAKGLEFPHVILVGLEEDLFPHRRHDGACDEEEERRLFYVGLTRAMESATLLTAYGRQRFGRRSYARPSIFLGEIPPELTHVVDDVGGEDEPEPDRSIEYEMDEEVHIRKGARIQHRSFGPGTVSAISGRGGDARVVIDFDSGDRKKFIARYAGLEPLDW